MLTLESCRYTPSGAKRPILDIDRLTVRPEEQVVIVGPSGSGKTTLLHALSGLLLHQARRYNYAGRLIVDDEVIPAHGSSLRKKNLAFLSQELALWPHMTCLEHLSFILTCGRSLKDDGGRFWLDQVDLGHRLTSRPHQLSGGEQKRLALARVLAARPRYLFLDEPFANIDLVLAEELVDIIIGQQNTEKFALVTVTHHRLGTKKEDCRIVILDKGRIVQMGTFWEIRSNPVNSWTERWARLVE